MKDGLETLQSLRIVTMQTDLPDSVHAFPNQRKEPLTDRHARNVVARLDRATDVSDPDRVLAFENFETGRRARAGALSKAEETRLTRRSGASTIFESKGAREDSGLIPKPLIVAGIFGFLLATFLIVHSGAAEVAAAMLTLGWWLFPITLYHLVPLSCDTLAWRQLLPAKRPGSFSLGWMRWIRESVNDLLPVAGVGGDIASARLVHQRGVPGANAAAAMVVDVTVGVAAQLVFVLVGVTLLADRSSGQAAAPVMWAMLIGVAGFVAGIAGFVLVQHKNMFAMLARLTRRVTRANWPIDLTGNASAVDDVVVATYRRGFPVLRACLLSFAGWTASAGEVWLVMHFLSRHFSVTDAFILQSLVSGIDAAAFMVPGALGVREGGFVLFGALFGLPAEIALAIPLAKRVRELALGLPGLVAWQWVEGRHLVRGRDGQKARR